MWCGWSSSHFLSLFLSLASSFSQSHLSPSSKVRRDRVVVGMIPTRRLTAMGGGAAAVRVQSNSLFFLNFFLLFLFGSLPPILNSNLSKQKQINLVLKTMKVTTFVNLWFGLDSLLLRIYVWIWFVWPLLVLCVWIQSVFVVAGATVCVLGDARTACCETGLCLCVWTDSIRSWSGAVPMNLWCWFVGSVVSAMSCDCVVCCCRACLCVIRLQGCLCGSCDGLSLVYRGWLTCCCDMGCYTMNGTVMVLFTG